MKTSKVCKKLFFDSEILMDFINLSKFYKDLKFSIKTIIAKDLTLYMYMYYNLAIHVHVDSDILFIQYN